MSEFVTPEDAGLETQVAVIANVDVLIVGAGSSAVAAALEAKARGTTVFVVSDRGYFGEESAGALELWPRDSVSNDPLFRSLFPERNAAGSRPGLIKHALELALLRADIPFRFLMRSVGLFYNDDGGIAGVVLAYRTSLYGVRCRSVVDATRNGLIFQLAGKTTARKTSSDFPISLVAMTDGGIPEDWELDAQKLEPLPSFAHRAEGKNFEAWRLTFPDALPTDSSLRDWAGLEHRLRARLLDNRFVASADRITLVSPNALADELGEKDDPLAAFADFEIGVDGLIPGNSLLPLSKAGLLHLDEPGTLIDLGRAVGVRAAEWIAARRKTFARLNSPIRLITGGCASAVAGNPGEKVGFAPAFCREGGESLGVIFSSFPDLGSCDVLIAGGGTGGAAAGISAARRGTRVVVLEMLHGLGGVGTLGLINRYYSGNRTGFTIEIDQEIAARDPSFVVGKSSAWNPELKMSWYHRALLDAGGEAWLRSFAFGVIQKSDTITQVLVSTPFGIGVIRAKVVIDATGNADIAAAAGAPCQSIGDAHVAVQGSGLSPDEPGRHKRNSDYTFIEDSDVAGVTHAFVNARAKFTEEFDVGPLVDSRERRRIVGELELSPLDILTGRTFPDTMVTALSDFDSHGFTVHPIFMMAPPDRTPLFAHVPFRAMLPQGPTNLLVIGLGMSVHRDALPVVRMQADVQNQGYGAGLAAAISAGDGMPLRSLEMRSLQRQLIDKGILASEVIEQNDSFPLNEEIIREAVETGPRQMREAAILLSQPTSSRPLLLANLETETDADRRLDYALILGLMGEPVVAPLLAEHLRNSAWDDGWNFKGMYQRGRSMSPLDACIIALARTGSPLAIEPILGKMALLESDAAFSHCRAVSVAAVWLRDPTLAKAFGRLISLPGMQGHAHRQTFDVITEATSEVIETDSRNLSLRELYLARGLYLSGDSNGLGRLILTNYANDLRGHYARHAQAVLANPLVPFAGEAA